jgi:alpha/beta hydrolase fold
VKNRASLRTFNTIYGSCRAKGSDAHFFDTSFSPKGIMPVTDYQNLIDAPTWAFIRRTDACYPADSASRSFPEQRATYDAMARAFHRGYPAGITTQDETIAGVPCRIYQGVPPAVIYLHGGGFIMGGLHSHDDLCAEICARTGFQVVSVDYRLAPEHPHTSWWAILPVAVLPHPSRTNCAIRHLPLVLCWSMPGSVATQIRAATLLMPMLQC